jgi:hypothetical protein
VVDNIRFGRKKIRHLNIRYEASDKMSTIGLSARSEKRIQYFAAQHGDKLVRL